MIPIFVISFNRLWCLQPCIEALCKLGEEVTLIVIDNGSSYPPLLSYLKALEKKGIEVYYRKPLKSIRNLYGSIIESVNLWFKSHEASFYGICDCDIVLENPSPTYLQTFTDLLKEKPTIQAVGCILRIDDIPDYYPLKATVLKRHKRFTTSPLHTKEHVTFVEAPIDTTFAIYRSSYRKAGVTKAAIRLCGNFQAKHLDWYINPNDMMEDQILYLKGSTKSVSHWGGGWLKSRLK